MEKAHPDVFNILLQVLDDGRLTDGQGRVVSFKNTIIIMTSNVGSQVIANAEQKGESKEEMHRQVNDALRATFKPEFLNRIDDIVVFHPLGLDDIEKIVDIQLKGVRERLAKERITLELTPAAIQALALDGLDPVYGARPLKRLIQRQVVDNVANLIIAGKLHENDVVRVDVRGDNEFFAERDAEASAKSAVKAQGVDEDDGEPVEPDAVELSVWQRGLVRARLSLRPGRDARAAGGAWGRGEASRAPSQVGRGLVRSPGPVCGSIRRCGTLSHNGTGPGLCASGPFICLQVRAAAGRGAP